MLAAIVVNPGVFLAILAAAALAGTLGAIVLLTLILSTQSTVHNALILVAFVCLAVGVAIFAVRSSRQTLPLFERTLESSSQLAVRWILVLIFALSFLAYKLGLDLLLGGFARRRDHHPSSTENARDADVRLQAHRRGVRGLRTVLLRRQRNEPRRGRAVRQRG